jgi:hypothetical protein
MNNKSVATDFRYCAVHHDKASWCLLSEQATITDSKCLPLALAEANPGILLITEQKPLLT